MPLTIKTLHGRDIASALPEIARLRIEVFREFPYLYEGNMAYEQHYLERYLHCPDAIAVLALDGDQIVGVSTGLPLIAAEEDFQKPFLAHDLPVSDYFYCAESVLQKSHRGQGLGHQFFDHREAHARQKFSHTCFCAVNRPHHHPLKPPGYHPHDSFWTKRGYTRKPHLEAHFTWQDLKEETESKKSLTFWTKALVSSDQL
ncbi:MAG: GNAT family N-acetyltransferase [Akkermansiaceae bacterium]|jgi:GNAT superfamily N-acetyltransferase